MVRTVPFKCPHCGALYQVVKKRPGQRLLTIRSHAALAERRLLAGKGH